MLPRYLQSHEERELFFAIRKTCNALARIDLEMLEHFVEVAIREGKHQAEGVEIGTAPEMLEHASEASQVFSILKKGLCHGPCDDGPKQMAIACHHAALALWCVIAAGRDLDLTRGFRMLIAAGFQEK